MESPVFKDKPMVNNFSHAFTNNNDQTPFYDYMKKGFGFLGLSETVYQ